MSAKSLNQHTISKKVSLAGTSLHTGEKVTLSILPADPDHGYKFCRVDLADKPIIDVDVKHVKTVERATTLMEGNVKVQTCEHILSALSGMGVDNAMIEMDANEPPIADGSARPFVEMIQKAGLEDQNVARKFFEPREPVSIETKSGAILVVLPDSKFRISCTQSGPDGRFTQYYSTEITPEIFETEIAPARTFVYYEDVKPLMDKGLIKGGSLENALVVQGTSIMGKEALRFEDEFVRHKILDIVGDLTLAGARIKGHVVAIKPGHDANTQLAKALAKDREHMLSLVPPTSIAKNEGVLDIEDVMKILPHRYPFLMVDRIIEVSDERNCVGVKSVTINEPFFQGHFPGHPVMPGVLQVEAMAQVASVLLLRSIGGEGRIGYFMSADKVKFRKPVVPGDTLFIHAEMTKARRSMAKALCKCIVNGEVVSQGDLMFAVIDK